VIEVVQILGGVDPKEHLACGLAGLERVFQAVLRGQSLVDAAKLLGGKDVRPDVGLISRRVDDVRAERGGRGRQLAASEVVGISRWITYFGMRSSLRVSRWPV
jgi:hypothetical protein